MQTKKDYDKYLRSDYWQGVREQILERDGHRCRLCNSEKDLQVHHRTYEFLGNEKLEELITLCKICHNIFHKRNSDVNYTTHCSNKKYKKINKEIDDINDFIVKNHEQLDILKLRLDKEKYIKTSEFKKVIKKINKKFDFELFINCCLNYVYGINVNSWSKDVEEKFNLPKRSMNIILDRNIFNLETYKFTQSPFVTKLLIK